MTEPILLFLDINGVIDVQEDGKTPEQISKRETGYPVPGTKEFLQVIDSCPWIHPMWISSWGLQSQVWNKWSKTRLWPVAYSFEGFEKEEAVKLFPDASDKYLAARWHSRDWQHRIVWIEDGFCIMRKAVNWAQSNPNIQIIDTSPTMKERCQGYETGIRYWNIERICNALDIQENREILLNQIKAPVPDLTQNIISDIESNQKITSNQINASITHFVEPLKKQLLDSNKDAKNSDNPTPFMLKIRNFFKLGNRT
ncbi:hypothetical protein [Nostoc sp. MG11]|uniref:hypothetical protein n=1 Tax=Nostoc sp. MG11 TaxID=2721166 RepID=UPI0018680678|nr:hypothetical protein [Nostoc sp. MG11]